MKKLFTTLISLTMTFISFCSFAEEAKEIRIGHFPNITHAQAVYAQGTGELEKKIGVPVRWSVFNAGPSAIEALFANAIDVTYIGPNPAINGYIKSRGESLRIIAGAASGGAALVVRPDSGIQTEKDFHGKTIATPQLGNTQDVAARSWFKSKGYQLKEKGGDLNLIPIENPSQLLLFQKKEMDGAWTVEPWVSRLELEAGGRIFLEEKTLWPEGKFVTSHLAVSKKFLDQNPALVKKLLNAHVEITQKINTDKQVAIHIINQELKKETGKALPNNVIQSAMNRLMLTWDPVSASLRASAEAAYRTGFFREVPNLNNIYNLSLLYEILKEKRLPPVQ